MMRFCRRTAVHCWHLTCVTRREQGQARMTGSSAASWCSDLALRHAHICGASGSRDTLMSCVVHTSMHGTNVIGCAQATTSTSSKSMQTASSKIHGAEKPERPGHMGTAHEDSICSARRSLLQSHLFAACLEI